MRIAKDERKRIGVSPFIAQTLALTKRTLMARTHKPALSYGPEPMSSAKAKRSMHADRDVSFHLGSEEGRMIRKPKAAVTPERV